MGRPIVDLTGQRFGSFLVLGPPQRDPDNSRMSTMWPSQCKCGAVHLMRAEHLKRKFRDGCTSCLGGARVTHGMAGTPTYATWCRMKIRCLSPDSPDYPDYGGRGITICDRWLNSFENFLEDMGEKPSGLSIDRIDNNLLVDSYSKNNCRWATPKQQSNNRRPRRDRKS